MPGVREQFDTAEDGTPLFWSVQVPTDTVSFPPPWDVVLSIHGGGFHNEEQPPEQTAFQGDAIANGWAVIRPDYRLAPPNTIPGQVSLGHYPDSLNDIKRCALKAMSPDVSSVLHGKVSGRYLPVGGSAGGSFAIWLACDTTVQSTPVAWDGTKRAIAAITLSGPSAFDDTMPDHNLATFQALVHNYCNTTDLTTLHNDSPYATVESTAKPMWIRNGTSESMPQNQLVLLVAALDAAGVTNYTSILDSSLVPSLHSWHAYPAYSTQVLAYITAIFAGNNPPPPPPPSNVPKGVCALLGNSVMPDQVILDNPDVDLVALQVSWADLEPSAGTYDYATFLDPQIIRVAAAGKKCLIRVMTEGGSETFGGNTPDHVFTAIKTAVGTPFSGFTDGVTNSTPLVTSATANFTYQDLFQPITGTDIPSTTYIGQVNNNTTIHLSSSANAYVPVNATGAHTGNTITLSHRPDIGAGIQAIVPGSTYVFDQAPFHGGIPTTTCIPVFWEPTYMLKKKNMLTALTRHLNDTGTFTQAQIDAIQIIQLGIANAVSEEWDVPVRETVDIGYPISQLDAWLNATNATTVYPGAGYQSSSIVSNAINQVVHDQFADGVANGSTTYTSATAAFRKADEGKVMTGDNINSGARIVTVNSLTSVTLSENATAGSALNFRINQRDTGLIDLVMAEATNQYVAMSIGSNGLLLDAVGAAAAGDTDVPNYLARTISAQAAAKYPGKFVAKVSTASNTIQTSQSPNDDEYKLLKEINVSGRPTAAQNLYFVHGDNSFLMNGGTVGDPTLILEGTANRADTYGIAFEEVYAVDCINLSAAIHYIHVLLTGTGGGGGVGSGVSADPPLQIEFRPVGFREGVLNGVAALLTINPDDLASEIANRWIFSVNSQVDFVWTFYDWPELYTVEERAFRQIWNGTIIYGIGDEFYYLGTLEDDGTITGTGYYTTIGIAPPMRLPTDTNFFLPFSLNGSDRYIELLQRYRRRIGQVDEVYDSDPRDLSFNPLARSLPWKKSQRGIEVACSQDTVFIRYKVEPWEYTATMFDPNELYSAGDLVLWTDGEVYRSITGSPAGAPSMISPQWAWVGFPRFLRDYVVYMTASENAEDFQNSTRLEQNAEKFLVRNVDKLIGQRIHPTNYSLDLTSRHRFPQHFPLVTTVPTSPTVNTISNALIDEWGEIIPIQ